MRRIVGEEGSESNRLGDPDLVFLVRHDDAYSENGVPMTRWRAVPEVPTELLIQRLQEAALYDSGSGEAARSRYSELLACAPSPADDDAEVERIARLIRQEVMIADGYTREQALHDEDALWFHFKPVAIAVFRAMGGK